MGAAYSVTRLICGMIEQISLLYHDERTMIRRIARFICRICLLSMPDQSGHVPDLVDDLTRLSG